PLHHLGGGEPPCEEAGGQRDGDQGNQDSLHFREGYFFLLGSKKIRMSALLVPRSSWARLRASRVERLGLLGELRNRLVSPSSRLHPSCRVASTPEFFNSR